MDILNTITEDLRLKDWEHSLALKNITILEGKQRNTLLRSSTLEDLSSCRSAELAWICIFIEPLIKMLSYFHGQQIQNTFNHSFFLLLKKIN